MTKNCVLLITEEDGTTTTMLTDDVNKSVLEELHFEPTLKFEAYEVVGEVEINLPTQKQLDEYVWDGC